MRNAFPLCFPRKNNVVAVAFYGNLPQRRSRTWTRQTLPVEQIECGAVGRTYKVVAIVEQEAPRCPCEQSSSVRTDIQVGSKMIATLQNNRRRAADAWKLHFHGAVFHFLKRRADTAHDARGSKLLSSRSFSYRLFSASLSALGVWISSSTSRSPLGDPGIPRPRARSF